MARGTVKTLGPKHYLLRWDEPRGPDGERVQRQETVHCLKKEADALLNKILEDLDNSSGSNPLRCL